MANRAAWLTHAKAHPLSVSEAPMPTPGPNQLLVKVLATAMNPCDSAIQSMGILVQHFPSILGEDLAGEVISVGSSVTRFQPGDRVVGLAAGIEFGTAFSGSFQAYTLVNDHYAAKIPENVSYAQACVLPLGLCTAASSMLGLKNLALPLPQINPDPTSGKVVLVWGASSSVGSCAVQLALSAGYEVATTSSARNLDYCRDLGAKYIFDYKSEGVVEDVVSALQGLESPGVMCAIIDDDSMLKCAEIAQRLKGRNFVASVKAPIAIDVNAMPQGWPEDVEMGWCMSSQINEEPCGAAIWEHWLSAALQNGIMKCKPDPDVVGKGLEKVQRALDLMAEGVSAKKLVIGL